MTDQHWFDAFNVSLVHNVDRRGFLRATAALLAGAAIGGVGPLAEAKRKHHAAGNRASGARKDVSVQGGGNNGKRKRRGKNNHDKNKPDRDPSCEAACTQEFDLHPEEIPACVRKCNDCRIRENFCVIEGDSSDPTKIATCCFEGDQCCQATHACCPMDSICCPGYPQASPQPCCGKDETCCPSDQFGCCSKGLTCCPGEGCVRRGSNQRNCGECGIRCSDDEYCDAGRCIPVPPDACPGRTPCGGNCVDTHRDRMHCGMCHKPCRDGEECRNGKCVCAETSQQAHVSPDGPSSSQSCEDECPSGLTRCGSDCVDTKTNRDHCGGCFVSNPNGLKCCDGNLCTYIDGVCCGGTCYPSNWPSCE